MESKRKENTMLRKLLWSGVAVLGLLSPVAVGGAYAHEHRGEKVEKKEVKKEEKEKHHRHHHHHERHHHERCHN